MSQPGNVFVGRSLPESGWDFVSQEQSTALLHGIGEHPEDRRLVYRTDLEKNPWIPKSTVKDRHYMRFRISNVGNGTLRKLKDFWNDQFRKEQENFFRPIIEGCECMRLVSLVRYGLADDKEDDLQPRVWMIIKPGYWGKNLELSQKVRSGAHAIEYMLSENGFKNLDICVDVVECDVIPLVGPKMSLPPEGLDPATNLQVELSTALGRCISSGNDLQSQGTQGFWLKKYGDPDAVYGLTARHVVEPLPGHDAKMSNGEYRYQENSGALKARICLLGDRYSNSLVNTCKRVENSQDNIIKALMVRADNEDSNKAARDDARRNVDMGRAEERRQMARDFAQELKQWKGAEERCIGHVDIASSLKFNLVNGRPPGYEIDTAIIRYDTRKLPDNQKTPKNIIHIGGKYTWEEANELLNSNVKNKFKFTIGRNGQIALTTKVVTIKELMEPDMFDAEGEKRRLVYKYGQATKFTIGVVNEAVSGERREVKWADGTQVEMVIDFTILSLSTTYGDSNKNHGDFAARGGLSTLVTATWSGKRGKR